MQSWKVSLREDKGGLLSLTFNHCGCSKLQEVQGAFHSPPLGSLRLETRRTQNTSISTVHLSTLLPLLATWSWGSCCCPHPFSCPLRDWGTLPRTGGCDPPSLSAAALFYVFLRKCSWKCCASIKIAVGSFEIIEGGACSVPTSASVFFLKAVLLKLVSWDLQFM